MSVKAFVIEDDEDLSTIFADALETVGYEVEQIKDGLIAQQRLKEDVLVCRDREVGRSVLFHRHDTVLDLQPQVCQSHRRVSLYRGCLGPKPPRGPRTRYLLEDA